MRRTLLVLGLLLGLSHPTLQAQDDEMRPLITDVSQLSSPFSDYLEGTDIGALIDGNTSTFWHSDWHNQTTGDLHWVDVRLDQPAKGIMSLYMHRRNAANDHPTEVVISGSNDGTSWSDIATVSLPYQGFTGVTSDPFIITDAVGHIRLTVTDCDGTGGYGFRKLWHAAEIQLYQISEDTEYSTELTEVCINEIQVANIDQFIDNSYNYGGWIELYNSSSTTVTLDHARIRHTDADGIAEEHVLTMGHGLLDANGHAILWFDHNSADGIYGGRSHLQIPFKMDPDGGHVELIDSKGTVVDAVDYPPAIARCSYARATDGSGTWGWTSQATPKKSNAGITFADERLEAPVISKESTLFTSSLSFNVDIPTGCTLRYTTDGSTPTATHGSTSAHGTFTVSETTVYRFVLISDDKLPGPVATRTFIKDTDGMQIPVLCISTHPDNLYDETIGVYTKGTNGVSGNGQSSACNWNMDWERPVNVEYLIEENGTYHPVLNQEAEFKIAGGWSRAYGGGNGWEMKSSFRLKTGKVYEGNNSFDYPIFADSKPYNKYKTLQVRNGGNDTYARIYDAATHQIFLRSGFYIDCQAWQPCHVFFNGEYLGMFNLRENNNKHYGESGYGIDTDEMDQFEINGSVGYEQKAGTRDAFWQWLQLTKQLAADPTDESIWQEICDMVDIDEFCNYMAAECYIGSSDWLTNSNNIKGFRSRTDDGKFHLVMFDTDSGFGNSNMISSANSLLNRYDSRYSDNDGVSYLAEIFFNMLKYEPFKWQFIHAFSIVDGSVMEPGRCKEIIDGMVAYTKDALAIEGNDPTASANKLYNHIAGEASGRKRINNMKSFMGLTEEYNVSIESNIPEARMLVEGQEIPTRKFDGTLFGPVSVTTKAPAGYTFRGWQLTSDETGEGGSLISTQETLVFDEKISGSKCHITAIYETQENTVPPVRINEVSAGNSIYINDYYKKNDWIELYNTTDKEIDVSGMYLSDDRNNPRKYRINVESSESRVEGGSATHTHPDGSLNPQPSTLIPAYGRLIVWCDKLAPVGQLHAPFKLDNEDGATVTLLAEDGTWHDELEYRAQDRWHTYGRYPDGGAHITHLRPSIALPNMMSSYTFTSENNEDWADIQSPSVTASRIVSVTYYTLSGIRISRPASGIFIEHTVYEDGTTVARKIWVNRNLE